jgi:RNA polymerase sigma-70 factor (ECF subfamily)
VLSVTPAVSLDALMSSRLPTSAAASEPGRAQADSDAWLNALRATGPERAGAVDRLHQLLVRAARFEVSRRRAALAHVRGEELDDIALQAADDALVAVLAKLDDYRGASRFTTWAYKFALLEAGVRLRRRAWQEREVVLAPEAWPLIADTSQSPQSEAESGELMQAISQAIHSCLTEHQREVLVALALNGVPIDVLTERLGTTRGALYKTLHDARQKLRADLVKRGFTLDSI